ncbi:MAG: 3-hydroxyacyl-ACP dehydratase FabZ [Candidatus Puniceispirillales bacterium WSBS_2018_MAG_OTU23]
MPKDNIVLYHQEIIKLIPHRWPFLFIDRVENIVINQKARGIKAITSSEPHLIGHFPGHPIMPGVLIIEAMAQTAGTLIAYSNKEMTEGRYVYFTTIDKVKFRMPARPGNVLHLDVNMIANKSTLYKFEGTASIDDKVVANAIFSAMIVDP